MDLVGENGRELVVAFLQNIHLREIPFSRVVAVATVSPPRDGVAQQPAVAEQPVVVDQQQPLPHVSDETVLRKVIIKMVCKVSGTIRITIIKIFTIYNIKCFLFLKLFEGIIG